MQMKSTLNSDEKKKTKEMKWSMFPTTRRLTHFYRQRDFLENFYKADRCCNKSYKDNAGLTVQCLHCEILQYFLRM